MHILINSPVFLSVVGSFIGGALLACAAGAQEMCTYSHTTLRNHPNEADTNWTEEAQGLTQDDRAFWYVTNRGSLFRVPVEHDLATSFPPHFAEQQLVASCGLHVRDDAQCLGLPCAFPSE